VRVNIETMRALVRLRRIVASSEELSRRLAELEKKYDSQFRVVFDAIRELMKPPSSKPKHPVGFQIDRPDRQPRNPGFRGVISALGFLPVPHVPRIPPLPAAEAVTLPNLPNSGLAFGDIYSRRLLVPCTAVRFSTLCMWFHPK
jgi:hypothetical protein